MTAFLEQVSIWSIPVLVACVSLYAIIKKVPVYTVFTQGAKDGFSTAVMIIPYLTAMLCAIGMFRACGAMDFICNLLAPLTELIGLPASVLPMGIMRSFSGGAAEGLMSDILAEYGGSVGVSQTRHSIAAGLLGDLASLIASALIVNIMWF